MICLAVILGEPWGDFVSGCSQCLSIPCQPVFWDGTEIHGS